MVLFAMGALGAISVLLPSSRSAMGAAPLERGPAPSETLTKARGRLFERSTMLSTWLRLLLRLRRLGLDDLYEVAAIHRADVVGVARHDALLGDGSARSVVEHHASPFDRPYLHRQLFHRISSPAVASVALRSEVV